MIPPRVALVSLEPWDDTWRRNQHLSAELVRQRLVSSLLFVEPPTYRPGPPRKPLDGVTVRTPHRLPNRLAGDRFAAAQIRRWLTPDTIIWINDPVIGVHLAGGQRAVYDVTDDWRFASQTPRRRTQLVAAEDNLATTARTIVCSRELQRRWQDRYGVTAEVVHNGVDDRALADATPVALPGEPPHLGYVGTLHPERINVALLVELANMPGAGTVHLVGPDCLDETSRAALISNHRVRLHGPVPGAEVPCWLKAFDVLLSPHVVSDFTLSLDAIKAYEYLATDRPIVATPTSGFQDLTADGVTVAPPGEFTTAVRTVAAERRRYPRVSDASWRHRAREFAAAAALETQSAVAVPR